MLRITLASLLTVPAALGQVGVFPLEMLPPGDQTGTRSITPDGSLIGGSSLGPVRGEGRAAIWSTASRTGDSLGNPNGQGTAWVSDLSASGTFGLVSTYYRGARTPYFWSAQDGFTAVPGGADWSPGSWGVTGLSRDGHTAAGWAVVTGQGGRAAVWRDGVPGILPQDPAWHYSSAGPIAADGTIFGIAAQPGDPGAGRAVAWHGDSYSELFEVAGDDNTSPIAVSGDGSTVYLLGYDNQLRYHAYSWTQSTGLVELANPDGWASTLVFNSNDDGSIAVGHAEDPDGHSLDTAVVWVDGVAQRFDGYLTGFGIETGDWTFTNLSAVSADGRTFAGDGYGPSGELQGFVAIIPAPGTALLLAFVPCLARRRRR